jgi:Family of unknown function (DUF6644)
MTDLLEWIEGTPLASLARDSLYGFQILVAMHLLGIALAVGTLLWVDLRMLGVCLVGRPLAEIHRGLAKWFAAGFAIVFSSGAALFAGFATSAYGNFYFRVKLAAIVLAGLNALVFHRQLKKPTAHADTASPPVAVRAAGALSLAFWATVLVCGRMLSYTLF